MNLLGDDELPIGLGMALAKDTQAMDAFARQFGSYNSKTKTYGLDPVWVSFFNGFNYLGQATGII